MIKDLYNVTSGSCDFWYWFAIMNFCHCPSDIPCPYHKRKKRGYKR